jgi:hypothetical protein
VKKTNVKKKAASKKTPAAKKGAAKPAKKASTKASTKETNSRAETKPVRRPRTAKVAKVAKEGRRIPVAYHDDGITVIADLDSIERHASQGDSVVAEPTRALTSAMNRRDLVAFGTRGGGDTLTIMGLGKPFTHAELEENGARSRLACGLLKTGGRLVVTDWTRYLASEDTGKCEGELRAIDPGLYKVTVYRNVGRGLEGAKEEAPAEEAQKKRCHLVWLEKVEESETAPPFVNLPGADGWI